VTDQPEPAARILAVVETAIRDELTDGARAEALDGIRQVLADQPTADLIRNAIADAVQICNGPLIDHAASGVLHVLGMVDIPPADGAPGPACGEECAEGHTYTGRCALYDPTACTWPDCLTDGQQAELAEQVRASMHGEPTAPMPDQRQVCGCRDKPTTTCPAATWAGLTICVACPTPEPGTACAREPGALLRAATDPSPFLPRIRQAWVNTDDASDRLAALNADPERFRRIIDGQQRPNTLDLALIATACRVTVDWLISGTEPRLPARTTPDNLAATYPHLDGDVTVLGPEIFASSDGEVICWKGENYVRPDNPTAEDLNSGPPNASRLDICELPHQTIGEEDDCERRRDAASDDGLREQYAAAIAADDGHPWNTLATASQENYLDNADAVMAVRDEELARLRTDLAAETALRRERSELYDLWRSKANQLGDQLRRVQALHIPSSYPNPDGPGNITYCLGCENTTGGHPCNTLNALDGPADTTPPAEAHVYLSTGCLHGEHGYCQANTGSNGTKVPASCKFCAAACVCPCHREATP
jgi:hypothetical protein